MNCNKMEHQILLSCSGEISEPEQAKLNEHLADCEHCREYMRSSAGIVKTVCDLLPADEPSPSAVAAIVSAAGNRHRRARILPFPLHALQFAACAAVMILVAGGVLLLPADRQAERIDEMSAIISAVSDSSDMSSQEEALYDLADQLLMLQGFMEEDSIGIADPDVEQSPTVLRLRSTRELLSKKCV